MAALLRRGVCAVKRVSANEHGGSCGTMPLALRNIFTPLRATGYLVNTK